MTATPDDTLYNLLPEVLRGRDGLEPGFPLRTLLRTIAGQVDALSGDIAQVYDNWFIETCDDDLIPYFAQLVGLSLGPSLPAAAAGLDAVQRRRKVADAIANRRRKGSFSVLESLALATGWPALALEGATLALASVSVRFPAVGAHVLTDLGDAAALEVLGSPLSSTSALVDVRRLGSHRRPGANSPNGVAVWLWRLIADRTARAPAAASEEDGRYHIDVLGRDLALAVAPAAGAPAPPATELDVPIPLTRRMLAERLEDHYGPGRSLCLYRGAKPIDRAHVLVADLSRWHAHPPHGCVVIDPELGRLAFSERDPSEETIRADSARLSVGAIGGGSYARPLAPPRAPVYRVGAQVSGDHGTINGALKAWRDPKRGGGPAAVIEIVDDAVYREHLDVHLAPGESLEIRAAQGCRPVLIPTEADGGRPDRLRIRGAEPDAAGVPPALTLDGVWIARHALELYGAFAAVTMRHCTLVPAGAARVGDSGAQRHVPGLVVHGAPCPITISTSVVGRIRVKNREAGVEPLPLTVTDSVLDASDLAGAALAGADERHAWVVLTLARVTVLGGAHVHAVADVSDSLLTAPLRCERRQTGTVAFSYLPPQSRTPRRTQCQPDTALAIVSEEIALGEVPAAERIRRDRRTGARLVPAFDAVRFGAPGYGRLAAGTPEELQRGAHDEGQLGAYHDLWEPLRLADLRRQLRDYAPVGIDIDIRLAT